MPLYQVIRKMEVEVVTLVVANSTHEAERAVQGRPLNENEEDGMRKAWVYNWTYRKEPVFSSELVTVEQLGD